MSGDRENDSAAPMPMTETFARIVELSVARGTRYERAESERKSCHANSFTITFTHVTVTRTSNRINNFLLMEPRGNYNPLFYRDMIVIDVYTGVG